jgi:hypothetical protein
MAQNIAGDCGHASGSGSSGPAGAFASSLLTGCQFRPAAETRRLRTSEGRLRENIETTVLPPFLASLFRQNTGIWNHDIIFCSGGVRAEAGQRARSEVREAVRRVAVAGRPAVG